VAVLYCRAVDMAAETEQERSRRRHQRTLFDGVAQLYEASRLGYPSDIVEFAVGTAAVGAGSEVLEVGCGTGQLTESLACYGFRLTAIDIGPSMVTAARRRLDGPALWFQVSSFEDFTAADASFDLIVSGTAFHWVDPEVMFRKPAGLLRPGGWLALLETGERYDDPFRAALRGMWAARGGGGARVRQPHFADTEVIAQTGLFETAIHKAHTQRIARPAETVVGVENTRATSLSWPDDIRREFTHELRHHLRSQTEVHLTQETFLTMARVRPRPPRRPETQRGRRIRIRDDASDWLWPWTRTVDGSSLDCPGSFRPAGAAGGWPGSAQ
jgi:ubiquinone/menaquinone biosynthesis C-methylase UbiE